MAIAKASVSVSDGGLGLNRRTSRPVAVIGCCSGGSANAPASIASAADAISAFGRGPLIEMGASILELGAGPVVLCKAATQTAATAGSVTHTGTGVSELTVSGTPHDAYRVVAKITRSAATLEALLAAVRVSLDGGETFGEEVAIPVSGIVSPPNTGLTLTFDDDSAGSFVADDTYAFTTTAPLWNNAGLVAALNALLASSIDFEGIIVEGVADDPDLTSFESALATAETNGRYHWALLHARDQNTGGGESVSSWITALTGDFAAVTSTRCAVAAGFAKIKSRTLGVYQRRSVARVLAPRLAALGVPGFGKSGLAEHPGRVRTGPVEGLDDGNLYHDLRAYPALDTARFIGLQTHPGRLGFYATNRTAAPDGSDLVAFQRLRVMVEAKRVCLGQLTDLVGEDFITASGGVLSPSEADALDAQLTAGFARGMSGLVSSAVVRVKRTTNIVSGERIEASFRMIPLGYAQEVVGTVGFVLDLGE